MSRDEHTTPRHDPTITGRRHEPGGWEEKAGAPPGWERRNARTERLREGQDHPLHHGHTLHGDHAFDGGDRHDAVDESPSPNTPRGT